MKELIVALGFILLSTPAVAANSYTYAHNDAEYSIDLPEAPTVSTIWAEDKEIPYIENPPKFGAIGENALFKRVDPEAGDLFEVKITFLKADRDFLLNLTEEVVKQTLGDEYKTVKLDNQQFNYSPGSDTLRWATLSGFSVDVKNNLYYHVVHYLTGLRTVMLIRAKYTVENQGYDKAYKAMASSIKLIQ